MSDFDHEHVSHLLNIVAQCAGHSGKLGAISNEAMHELLELNGKMHAQGLERRKKAEADEAQKKLEANKKAAAANEVDKPKAKVIPVEPEQDFVGDPEPDDPTLDRPFVHPGDSETATLADRRL